MRNLPVGAYPVFQVIQKITVKNQFPLEPIHAFT